MEPKAVSILIVEDSFIVALHLKTTLEAEGYQVIGSCSSGEEALLFVEERKPQLVLMDIMLNGKLDGVETATQINTKFNIPIIYITALSDKSTIQRAKITQPFGFLTKPFEDREIFTVIEMALYKFEIESRLKESEEKFFSTVNSISDAVITINQDFNILYMNPSAEAITQWPLSQAVHQPVTNVLNLEDEETGDLNVNPAQCTLSLRSAGHMPERLLLHTKMGGKIPIGESSLSPLLNVDGKGRGLIISFKDMTEKRERERMISEVELKRTMALIEGQETERNRIAKDLHDGLGQMLNAIKMYAVLNRATDERATDMGKLLDEAIQESVRISENLMPAKLRDFDLAICLRSFCSQASDTTKLNISFEGRDHAMAMSQSCKVNFYRIAQEGVNNAVKHAKATTINVQWLESNHHVILSIEDNGGGILMEDKQKGKNGLTNMKDRALIMGGTLKIESDLKRGTLVIVQVPIEKIKEHE